MGLIESMKNLFKAGDDVVDLYVIKTDLIDIDLSEDEMGLYRENDARASQMSSESGSSGGPPVGKTVY